MDNQFQTNLFIPVIHYEGENPYDIQFKKKTNNSYNSYDGTNYVYDTITSKHENIMKKPIIHRGQFKKETNDNDNANALKTKYSYDTLTSSEQENIIEKPGEQFNKKTISISPRLKNQIRSKVIELTEKGELANYRLDSTEEENGIVHGIVVDINLNRDMIPTPSEKRMKGKENTKMAFAVKQIKLNDFSYKSQKVLFERELNALYQTMSCRYCVAFLGKFNIEDNHFIILEYMQQGSLRFILNRQQKMGFNEKALSQIAYQVLKGLEFLEHQGIVHRDIKPANLLVKNSGSVKIGDFGLCNKVPNPTASVSTVLGTPLYMAPERRLSKDYSFPSDIWAFGIVMYELASGSHPDDTKDMVNIDSKIQNTYSVKFEHQKSKAFSKELKDFIKKCVYINPKNRSTASQLLDEPFIQNHLHHHQDGKKKSSRDEIRKLLSEL